MNNLVLEAAVQLGRLRPSVRAEPAVRLHPVRRDALLHLAAGPQPAILGPGREPRCHHPQARAAGPACQEQRRAPRASLHTSRRILRTSGMSARWSPPTTATSTTSTRSGNSFWTRGTSSSGVTRTTPSPSSKSCSSSRPRGSTDTPRPSSAGSARSPAGIDDEVKSEALKQLFSQSKVALIYGAAGTGKSTMVDHIASYFNDKSKLFLAHTNPAIEQPQAQGHRTGLNLPDDQQPHPPDQLRPRVRRPGHRRMQHRQQRRPAQGARADILPAARARRRRLPDRIDPVR